MSSRMKILFCPIDAIGHINACLGIADLMSNRGHEVMFVVAKDWKSAIQKEKYQLETYEEDESENDLTSWTQLWKVDNDPRTSQADRDGKVLREAFKKIAWQVRSRHNFLKKLVQHYKPNLIVVDTLVSMPAVEASGIPWVGIWSANPIRMFSGHCPPADSGLPTTSDKKLWDEFNSKLEPYLLDIQEEHAKWMQNFGVSLNPRWIPDFLNDSPFLNVYPYPAELDYTDIAPPPENWFRLDGLIRKTTSNAPIPEDFLKRSGKKIYLSLGSLGSGNQELMSKLILTLSKVQYWVVLSLGPFAENYTLSCNMYGEKFVNQLGILPHVDLVITHGGNNTVIECLYAGRPMIVLPIFGDQPDNAQRIKEKNLGIRLDTFSFSEEELINAIETVINDKSMKKRLNSISERLKSSTRDQDLAVLLEKIVQNHKSAEIH